MIWKGHSMLPLRPDCAREPRPPSSYDKLMNDTRM
jgi:hypothetical protein